MLVIFGVMVDSSMQWVDVSTMFGLVHVLLL